MKSCKLARACWATALVLVVGCGSGGTDENNNVVRVSLGEDIQLKEGRTVQLAPNIVNGQVDDRYEWQQRSGPPLHLSSNSARQISITAPALQQDALAELALRVTSRQGQTSSDTIQLSLRANQLPVASIDTSILSEKSAATLHIQSWDPDGEVVAVTWQQTSGPLLQLVAADSANIAVSVPAVSKAEFATLQLQVSDDDGEHALFEHRLRIEPRWQEFTIGGSLVAQEMAQARLIAASAGEVFRAEADANSQYYMTVKLDDDASDDLLLIRALSVTKPGMDLMLAIPSLRNKPAEQAADITPYSSAVLALATRVNGGRIPKNKAELHAAEMAINSQDAAEAAMVIGAYAMQQQVALPDNQVSLFSAIQQPDSYMQLYTALQHLEPDLLAYIEQRLPQQGGGQLDIQPAQLQQGLRLESDNHVGQGGVRFYQFDNDRQVQVSDNYLSYTGNWSVVFGAALTHGYTELIPEVQLDVNNPDVSLSNEQRARLQAAGVTTLNVKIDLLTEQLRQLSRGASRDLMLRRATLESQVQAVEVDGEILEFFPQTIESEEYVWASGLLPPTLAISEQSLIGQWQMPVYRASSELDTPRFYTDTVVFELNRQGHIESSAEPFYWDIAVDLSGQTAILLTFANGQQTAVRLLDYSDSGFKADIFAYDAAGKWLAASADYLRIK